MPLFRFKFRAMASDCELHLYSNQESVAQRASQAAIDEVARIEQKYSRYRSDSELSRINEVAKAGGSTEVDSETAGLLDFAREAYELSGGLFDISSGLLRAAWDFKSGRVPEQSALDALLDRIGFEFISWKAPVVEFTKPGMEIDFGGIGKEYAVDRAGEVLVREGIKHGLVDLGGDMLALGPHPDGSQWRIGIRHPRNKSGMMAVMLVDRGGLATSGDYERSVVIEGQRYCHILNPRTGWPCQGLASVTVIADQCLKAGCVSTIAMLKGQDGIAFLAGTKLRHTYMDSLGQPRR